MTNYSYSVNYNYRNDMMIGMDIYSTVRRTKDKFYTDLMTAVNGLNKNQGVITLSDGLKIDMSTSGGIQAFGLHMNFMNSISSFIDDTFGFVKKFESSLGNMLQ